MIGKLLVSNLSHAVGVGEVPLKFVICGYPRSGSTVLQRTLNSHPQIICMHELLKESSGKPAFMKMFVGRRQKLLDLRDSNPLLFIEDIYSGRYYSIKAIGFKALYTHPRNGKVWEKAWFKLGEMQVYPIYLKRNIIESYVSFMIAWKVGQWVGGGRLKKVKISIDVNHMIKKCNQWLERENISRSILGAGIDINYENLQGNFSVIFADLCEYLEVDSLILKPSLSRYGKSRLRDRILNVSEVERKLNDEKLRELWIKAMHLDDERQHH